MQGAKFENSSLNFLRNHRLLEILPSIRHLADRLTFDKLMFYLKNLWFGKSAIRKSLFLLFLLCSEV